MKQGFLFKYYDLLIGFVHVICFGSDICLIFIRKEEGIFFYILTKKATNDSMYNS